ncbi:MAG: acyloxyacyl hydrolase [Ramlibacter sp.]
MPRSSLCRPLFALALASAAAMSASAAVEPDAASVFVQAGVGEDAVRVATVGVAWGLPWPGSIDRTHGVSTRLELFASGWRTRRGGGEHQWLLQVGVVPVLRVRFDDGRSPWFMEAGIGLALLNAEMRTPDRTFSTRLNFSDNLGAGRSFGAQGEHEVSLHLQHTSNAGLREPNPGLTLLLLRYAHRF